MEKARTLLDKLNISKKICNHVIGEEHSNLHRRITGIFIMVFGVGLVKVSASVDLMIIHFVGDVAGYLIHGVGAIPFIKALEKDG